MTQWFHFLKFIQRNRDIQLKECKHPYVHCSVIYNSQDLEAAQESNSRWVDKTTTVHLHNGILLNHKKEEILPFAIA